ncbi:hypothetical protein D3Z36_15275 [Lachnospiraceae bacterium]|nr:hypothetical protein [Lachnospiraceae bacterium]
METSCHSQSRLLLLWQFDLFSQQYCKQQYTGTILFCTLLAVILNLKGHNFDSVKNVLMIVLVIVESLV